jgi:PAS domain S-box-containing protein
MGRDVERKLADSVERKLADSVERKLADSVERKLADSVERKLADSVDLREAVRQIREHRNPYQEVLLELVRSQAGELSLYLSRVLETLTTVVGLDRVAFWRFDDDRARIVCVDLYERTTGLHEHGAILEAASYPRYFRALGERRTLAAEAAWTDPRTSEFAETYLVPNGITALLDVPVWSGGEVIGILCHEHRGGPRAWTREEQDFAAAVADLVALGLESAERHRMETTLREREQRLRLLTQRLPGIVWTADAALRVTSAAGAALEPLGLRPEVLEGTSIEDWFAGTEPHQTILEIHRRALAGGSCEARVRRGGRLLEIHAEPFRDDGGHRIGVIGLALDVTERQRAEEVREQLLVHERDARASAERTSRRASFLADASRSLGGALDERGVLDALVDLACTEIGDWAMAFVVRDGQVDGPPAFATRASDPRGDRGDRGEATPERTDALARLSSFRPDLSAPVGGPQAIRTGRAVLHPRVTSDMLESDGGRWPILATRDPEYLAAFRALGTTALMAVPIPNAHGPRDAPHDPTQVEGPVGALVIGRGRPEDPLDDEDVAIATELADRAALSYANATLRGRLEQALHARDEFLSVAAHELYTPLTALHLSLDGLRRGVEHGAPLDPRKLAIASGQGQRLARLVGELLDVSRIHAGVLELATESVDLAELTREIVAQLEPTAAAAGLAVVVHADARCEGQWDRGRLEQILTNVVGNAIKYGRGPSGRNEIEVTVSSDGSDARVCIRDHGIGIDRADLAKILEPFERAVSSRSYGGLGLGLYIVRRLVDAHGGSIAIESAKGVGTTVSIRLPRLRP